jgi:hypothetical protein
MGATVPTNHGATLERRAACGYGSGAVYLAARGLKVPAKQTPRDRLWLHDGSCVRLRPERTDHVWSYDFVSAMTHDGRTLRLLTPRVCRHGSCGRG